ncbi:MAG: signal peptidase I [Pseudomonadota bacterium]
MTETSQQPLPQTIPAVKPQKSENAEFLQFILKLALFVLILRSFIAAPFNIPSESMLPRLMIGDYLIVAKWPYGYSKYSLPFSVPLIPSRILAREPVRGDVIVFKAPPGNHTDYIKRVIGLPGDLIQVKGGQVILNGKPIPRKRVSDFIEPLTLNSACAKPDTAKFREVASDGTVRCRYPRYRETLPNGRSYDVLDLDTRWTDDTSVYAVPKGHLFAMGDNRDRSADSRFPAVEGQGIGIVPQENLVGRALFTVFSTDGSSSWIKPWTWFTAARWDRIGEGF